jgi:3-phosphoshikimate 1-carboxyvinyltransferase
MNYRISHPTKILKGTIELTASKSESNRALIIQALCEDDFEIKNLAAAEDTRVLKEILTAVKSNTSSEIQTYDVGAAGTTMRFLTAFLASKKGVNCILTGSERMQNRPIKILVDALHDLGADIEYIDKDGYPPLRIKGKELEGSEVEIDGSVSSQYISALLLITPRLKNGLFLKFTGDVTSIPYITMTLKVMEEFGIHSEFNKAIIIKKQKYQIQKKDYSYYVEGDWSSASYWYSIAALAENVDFSIKGLKRNSLQGDAGIANIFSASFGIKTDYNKIKEGLVLTKEGKKETKFDFNFSACPDIAQTVAVVVAALGIPSTFTGLHTLRIKETDRTLALKNELAKVGVEVEIVSDDMIKIHPKLLVPQSSPITTYEDHRMAMSFAPLALVQDSITIEHPEVVKKSYPDFWKDLEKVGFVIEEI